MSKNSVTSRTKIQTLLRYLKTYNVRDPITMGLIFSMCSEVQVMHKGVFLDDLSQMAEEPVLIIGYDKIYGPTRFTYNGTEYTNLNDMFKILHTFNVFYIYMDFPDFEAPQWYLNVCQPNPHEQSRPLIRPTMTDIHERQITHEDFNPVYKDALMVLINNALEHHDKQQFMVLAAEWKEIA